MGLVNEPNTDNRPLKLSEVLFDRPDRSFGTIAALPSNIEALDAALLFSAGLHTFVALIGPSGWGKTHLAEAVAFRLNTQLGRNVEPVTAQQYLAAPHRFDAQGPLILDDCQEVLNKPRQRALLRCALERRVRGGRPTFLLLTLPKVSRQVKNFLPNTRDWTIACVASPEPTERVTLLSQMSVAEGLALSPSLVRIIAFQMHGNGRTLSGVLKRLKLSGNNWLDSRATLRACGLLEPFFADNSSWDLKHKILKTAEHHRAQFSRVSTQDMAIYTMLREASLCESDVARSVGMEPAEVYLRASRFQKDIDRDQGIAAYVKQFVDHVVSSLAVD